VLTATAMAASVADPSLFRSGRQYAAFLGLVPRQNSSGSKERLGRSTKMGDGYLRKLLVVGATAILGRVADTQKTNRKLDTQPARVRTHNQ
jgi:transposase